MKAGDRVRVTGGVCECELGRLVGPSPYTFNGEPVWYVQVDGAGYTSTIRASFLVPAPQPSDDDVMSPLRRAVPG